MADKLFDLSGDVTLNTTPFDTAAEAVSSKLDELLTKMNAVEKQGKTVFNGTSSAGGLFGSGNGGGLLGGGNAGSGLFGGVNLSSIANQAIGTATGNLASDAVEGFGKLIGNLFGGGKSVDVPINLVLAQGETVQSQIDALVGENAPVIEVSVSTSFADAEIVAQDLADWSSGISMDMLEIPVVVSALDVEQVTETINQSIAQIQSALNTLVIPIKTSEVANGSAGVSPLSVVQTTKEPDPLSAVPATQSQQPNFKVQEPQTGWRGALSSFGGWLAENDDDAAGATKDIVGALLDGNLFDLLIDTGVNQSLNATGYVLQDAAGWLSPVPESFSGNVRIGNEEYSYPLYVAKEDRGFLGAYRPDTANKTFGISPRDQKILSRQSGGMNQQMFDLLPTEDKFFSSVAANLGSYAPGSTIPVSGLFDFDASNLLERLQEEFPEFNFEAVPELPEDAASKMQSQLNGMELSVPVNAYMSGGFDWRGGFDAMGTSFVDDVTKAFKNVSVVLDSGAIAGSVNDRLGRSSVLG